MPVPNSVAVDAPPLPIIPNPYDSDISAAQEASELTAEEDAMMGEEFSKSCDHEESERDVGANEATSTSKLVATRLQLPALEVARPEAQQSQSGCLTSINGFRSDLQ